MSVGAGYSVSVEDLLEKLRLHYNVASFFRVDLADGGGETVKTLVKPSNSFLLSFMDMLYSLFTAKLYMDFAYSWLRRTESFTIEGRTTSYTRDIAGIQAWALKEDDSHGIIVGTGTAPPTAYDTWLESQVRNGTGAGQMLHMSCDILTRRVVADMSSFDVKRSFVNASGGAIRVSELGLAVHVVRTGRNKLLIRDVIDPLDVPDGWSLTVTYTILVKL